MNRKFSWMLHIISSIVLVMASLACFSRNSVWENEIKLWNDAAAKSPRKSRPYNNLGKAHSKLNQNAAAIRLFQVALDLDPNNIEAHNNLGNSYRSIGQLDMAIIQYQEAVRIDPSYATAYNNMGTIYFDSGLFETAAGYYKTAVRFNAAGSEFHYNLARALRAQGITAGAIAEYQETVRLQPDYFQAYNSLGVIYEENKLLDKARYYYAKAVDINPEDAISSRNLARMLQTNR